MLLKTHIILLSVLILSSSRWRWGLCSVPIWTWQSWPSRSGHPAPPGARFPAHVSQSSNLGPNTELLACCSSPRTYPAPYWSQTFREHWNQIFSIKNQELSDSHLAHQPVELQHALEDGPHQICAPLFKLSVCTTHFLTLEASLTGAHL